jgi:hypothetical protein
VPRFGPVTVRRPQPGPLVVPAVTVATSDITIGNVTVSGSVARPAGRRVPVAVLMRVTPVLAVRPRVMTTAIRPDPVLTVVGSVGAEVTVAVIIETMLTGAEMVSGVPIGAILSRTGRSVVVRPVLGRAGLTDTIRARTKGAWATLVSCIALVELASAKPDTIAWTSTVPVVSITG